MVNNTIPDGEFQPIGAAFCRTSATGYPDADSPAIQTGELSEEHRAMLRDGSGLSDATIEARGYFTIRDKRQAELLGFDRYQACLVPALCVPIYNHAGERGYVIRPNIPRVLSSGKSPKYEYVAGASVMLDISPLTADQIGDPSKPLVITEGAKKADKAAELGLCAINLNGVYGYRGRNSKGGITALADWEYIAVNGRTVYVAFDSDIIDKPAVRGALNRVVALLSGRGAVVKIIELPNGPNGEKTGLDDYFVRGHSLTDFMALARDIEAIAATKQKRKDQKNAERIAELAAGGVPIIELHDRQLKDVLADMKAAIEQYNAKSPSIFYGAAGLVSIAEDRDGEKILVPVTREQMQVYASWAARFISTTERDGVRNVSPKREHCENFLAVRDLWENIPPIERVTSAPFFDAAGKLCTEPGYYRESRTWLSLPPGISIPDTTPTPQNVAAAKALILETLLGEVAFKNQPSRAHAVAQMILALIIRLVNDNTPLHLWNSPTPSSGKTYGAKICASHTSEAIPSADKKNNEENRKELIAKLISGPPNVFIDNVKSSLDDPTLATAITSPYIEGRLLGASTKTKVSTRVVWIATANNAQLDQDAVSRCVLIELDTDRENPETRKFKNSPLQYIAEHRGEVLAAIITLVRNWQQVGSPEKTGETLSRFKRWERVVGGILEVNEVPGFLGNMDSARENLNPEGDAWREFVHKWAEKFGDSFVASNKLLPLAMECEELGNAIGTENQAIRFGKKLRGKKDAVIAGFKITRADSKSKDGAKWRLKSLKTPENERNSPEKGDSVIVSDSVLSGLEKFAECNSNVRNEELENYTITNCASVSLSSETTFNRHTITPDEISDIDPFDDLPEVEA